MNNDRKIENAIELEERNEDIITEIPFNPNDISISMESYRWLTAY
jgi:hypothetical protein